MLRKHFSNIIICSETSAALIAAVPAKRLGNSIIVIRPDKHLSGLTVGGLGFTDAGNTAATGGLASEFHQRSYHDYQKESGTDLLRRLGQSEQRGAQLSECLG